MAAELVLHAGDFVSESFLEELCGLGRPVRGVCGNIDDSRLRALLPRERVVEVGGARIGMVHVAGPAAGRESRLGRRFDGCDAVVYGHTHVPQVDLFEGVWILNPGSPTERRRAPGRSMLLLEVEDGTITPSLVDL